MNIPMAGVVTVVPGAGPEAIERDVTDPLERSVESVEGVTGTTSSSASGFSAVTVELEYGTDMTEASQELQQAVNRVTASLPNDAEPDLILGSIDDMPVVQLAAAGSENGSDLLTTLNDEIIPTLEGISGVRDVELVGIDDDIVTIKLDNEELAESGLSAQSVLAALDANGTPMPVGTIIEDDSELAISVGESLTSIDEIAALRLRGEALPPLREGAGAGEVPGAGDMPDGADAGDLPEGAGEGDISEGAGRGEVPADQMPEG